MAQHDNERTPLLSNGIADQEGYNHDAALQKNPDNPANLSKSKVATILAANWVCDT